MGMRIFMKDIIHTISYAVIGIITLILICGSVVLNPNQARADYGYYGTPTYDYDYSYNRHSQYNNNGPLQVSCYPMPLSARTGESISWVASAYGGNNSYYYTWTGTDSLSGYGSSVSKTYYSSGYKSASVTVTSGGQTVSKNCDGIVNVYGNSNYNYDYNYNYNYYPQNYNYYSPLSVTCSVGSTYTNSGYSNGQSITQYCGSVNVGGYGYVNYNNNNINSNNNGLSIACYSDPTTVRVNQPVTWRSEVTGGISPYTYSWTGTSGLSGSDSSVIKYYDTVGEKSAVITIRSADGKTAASACSTALTVRSASVVTPTLPATPAQPVVQPPVQQQDENALSAAALFSLKNVPWGWVAIMIILVLFATVVYLIFNRQKI